MVSKFLGAKSRVTNSLCESTVGDNDVAEILNVGNCILDNEKVNHESESIKYPDFNYNYGRDNIEKAELDKLIAENEFLTKYDILKEFYGSDLAVYKDVIVILNRLKFVMSFEVTVLAKLLTIGIVSNKVNQICSDFFREEAKNCLLNAEALEMRVRRSFAAANQKCDFCVVFRNIFNMDLNVVIITLGNFIPAFILSYIIRYKDSETSFVSISDNF